MIEGDIDLTENLDFRIDKETSAKSKRGYLSRNTSSNLPWKKSESNLSANTKDIPWKKPESFIVNTSRACSVDYIDSVVSMPYLLYETSTDNITSYWVGNSLESLTTSNTTINNITTTAINHNGYFISYDITYDDYDSFDIKFKSKNYNNIPDKKKDSPIPGRPEKKYHGIPWDNKYYQRNRFKFTLSYDDKNIIEGRPEKEEPYHMRGTADYYKSIIPWLKKDIARHMIEDYIADLTEEQDYTDYLNDETWLRLDPIEVTLNVPVDSSTVISDV